MTVPEVIAPCGLDCRVCPDYEGYHEGLASTAARLRFLLQHHSIGAEACEQCGLPSFEDLMRGLTWMTEQENTCRGCAAGPGLTSSKLLPGCDPSCPIRTCARTREIRLCGFCPSFPCDRSHYSERGLANLLQIVDSGLESWLDQQQKEGDLCRKGGRRSRDIDNNEESGRPQ